MNATLTDVLCIVVLITVWFSPLAYVLFRTFPRLSKILNNSNRLVDSDPTDCSDDDDLCRDHWDDAPEGEDDDWDDYDDDDDEEEGYCATIPVEGDEEEDDLPCDEEMEEDEESVDDVEDISEGMPNEDPVNEENVSDSESMPNEEGSSEEDSGNCSEVENEKIGESE